METSASDASSVVGRDEGQWCDNRSVIEEESDSEENILRIVQEKRQASISPLGRYIPEIVDQKRTQTAHSEARIRSIKQEVLSRIRPSQSFLRTSTVSNQSKTSIQSEIDTLTSRIRLSNTSNFKRIQAAICSICLPGEMCKVMKREVVDVVKEVKGNCVIVFKGGLGRRELGAVCELQVGGLRKVWGPTHFPVCLPYQSVHYCYRYDCASHSFHPLLHSQLPTADAVSLHSKSLT